MTCYSKSYRKDDSVVYWRVIGLIFIDGPSARVVVWNLEHEQHALYVLIASNYFAVGWLLLPCLSCMDAVPSGGPKHNIRVRLSGSL
jgi:hypothetical protein